MKVLKNWKYVHYVKTGETCVAYILGRDKYVTVIDVQSKRRR